jgi:GAF domain-containing protein
VERHPIVVDGEPVGWVDGPRPAGAIASVIAYACAREADKRALAHEALERYRELNVIYELAEQLGGSLEVDAVARVAVGEATRLQTGSEGFLFLRDPSGGLVARPVGDPTPLAADHAASGLLGAIALGDAEIINDVASDPRANAAERGVSALVAAPLKVRGERIGVVGTASVAPFEYRAGDLRVVIALAALTGPTLKQALVHQAALRDLRSSSHAPDLPMPGLGRGRSPIGR